MRWPTSVLKACLNEACQDTKKLTRKNLIKNHLNNIVEETKSIGKTPFQTLNKVLQDLRDLGFLEFNGKGNYKLLKNDLQFFKDKSSKGEKLVKEVLEDLKIEYSREQKFKDLKFKSHLRFDFYIENNNRKFVIEFDGIQHFRPIAHFGGEKTFILTQIKDNIKNEYCLENNIKMIRMSIPNKTKIKKIIEREIL